ncbi:MAG: glycosyltransferase, partial [Chloroflexi bacterium]|nr:glycosyltransferase [Chloroflexota bacterium]
MADLASLVDRAPSRTRERNGASLDWPTLDWPTLDWPTLDWPTIGLAAWGAFTGFDAWRRYLALPEVRLTAGRASQLPSLSVVVPARDEEANLRRLLPTLVSQDYPALEVVVVDDGSADGTAAVAAELGARIVSAGPLPSGWAGKPHACWVGANAADGDWLLFVDADTEHRPGALVAALTYALDRDLDGLTLFLQQRCTGFAEWLLLPYAYQRYFAAVRPAHLTDPAAPDALANGQYLLVSRAAYDRAGGHAAVAGSVVEDVDLARVFKRAGIRLRPARGEELASVRMYAGLAAIRAGFGKNSYAFLAADAGRGLQIAFGTVAAG